MEQIICCPFKNKFSMLSYLQFNLVTANEMCIARHFPLNMRSAVNQADDS